MVQQWAANVYRHIQPFSQRTLPPISRTSSLSHITLSLVTFKGTFRGLHCTFREGVLLGFKIGVVWHWMKSPWNTKLTLTVHGYIRKGLITLRERKNFSIWDLLWGEGRRELEGEGGLDEGFILAIIGYHPQVWPFKKRLINGTWLRYCLSSLYTLTWWSLIFNNYINILLSGHLAPRSLRLGQIAPQTE